MKFAAGEVAKCPPNFDIGHKPLVSQRQTNFHRSPCRRSRYRWRHGSVDKRSAGGTEGVSFSKKRRAYRRLFAAVQAPQLHQLQRDHGGRKLGQIHRIVSGLSSDRNPVHIGHEIADPQLTIDVRLIRYLQSKKN